MFLIRIERSCIHLAILVIHVTLPMLIVLLPFPSISISFLVEHVANLSITFIFFPFSSIEVFILVVAFTVTFF